MENRRGEGKTPTNPFGRPKGIFYRLQQKQWFNILIFIISIYFFIIGIKLMGSGFKGLGHDFANDLIETTSNPLVGLCIGVLATAVVQSSSATTSTVVAMVVANPAFFPNAIPIVIGANIGTSVTNILVSLGHIRHPPSFRRAFGGALVHDFFNVISASLIFPMEWLVRILTGKGFLERMGEATASAMVGEDRNLEFDFISRILDPVLEPIKEGILNVGLFPETAMIIVGLLILFASLTFITKAARRAIDGKVQELVDKVLFRNTATSFIFGLLLTAFVQSSSVTTSIAVPLVGGGILSIEQIFPYTLGANVGTTVTALMAAIASQDLTDPEGSKYALAISFVHLYFNLTGIVLLLPFKKVPIYLARKVARYISLNRKMAILFLIVVFFLIPGAVILFDRLLLS